MRALLASTLVATVSCQEAAHQDRKPGGFVPDGNMERAQVPDGTTWQLAPLFADDDSFAAALNTLAARREQLVTFAGKLGSPAHLRECLDLYFDIRLETNRATLYANLRYTTDTSSTDAQAMRDKSLDALNALMSDAGFIRQEILGLSDSAVETAYTSEPRLREYAPYIDEQRRRRARLLAPEAERVLSLAGDNLWAEIDLNEIPSDHEKTFGAAITDLQLPKLRDENNRLVQLTLSNYGRLRASGDRRVRRQAVEKLFGTLKEYQHILAGTLSGQVRFNIFLARARGYDRAIEAYLDKDNIDVSVYENLIQSIRANLEPLHDYVALRKKAMGVDEVRVYDLYTPLVAAVDMQFPYERAAEILPAALAPLGPEYVAALTTGLDPTNGWLDLYPSKGKESGAFCASLYGTHPFVKMNYFEGYGDLSTLAHEYGHALHAYYSGKTQPYVTFHYPAFVAEVASTINEKLLSDHLVANAESDAEKLFILSHLVESIRTTIYRQTLFADFELQIHTAAENGTPLTAEFLNETYRDLIATYYGDGFTIGENDDIEWAYIPHFYYKFYVFTYATGLSSGIALSERVQSGDPAQRDAFLGMLAAGSSKPPLELLRDAGVDLTEPTAVEAAARLMAETLKQMEALLARSAPAGG